MTSLVHRYITAGWADWGVSACWSRKVVSLCTFKVAARSYLSNLFHRREVSDRGARHGAHLRAWFWPRKFYYQFHQVKMDTATLALVGVSMCSELGARAYQLDGGRTRGRGDRCGNGTMRVTEQIDALRTLRHASRGLPGRAMAARRHPRYADFDWRSDCGRHRWRLRRRYTCSALTRRIHGTICCVIRRSPTSPSGRSSRSSSAASSPSSAVTKA